MSPEDPMQFDSLASKLAALKPASAAQLQALAFYEAGKRDSCSHSAPALLKLRSLAASVALAIVCSAAAYYAGSQRNASLHLDMSEQIAIVAPAQSDSAAPAAGVQPGPAEHTLEDQIPASDREPVRDNYYAQMVAPQLLSWLQLPQRNAEDYLRDIEVRTRPLLSRSAGIAESSDTTLPTSRRADSFDRQLPELERLQLDTPLRRWLSM